MALREQFLRLVVGALLVGSVFYLATQRTGEDGETENILRKKRFPDVVIVGVKKSGTMTLGRTTIIIIIIIITFIIFCRHFSPLPPEHQGSGGGLVLHRQQGVSERTQILPV